MDPSTRESNNPMHGSRLVSDPRLRVLCAAMFLVLILALQAPKVSLADSVTSTVTVGIQPEGIAFDPTNGYLYVANFGSGTVSVIDGSTNTVVTTVTVGNGPVWSAIDPTNGCLYVANFGSNSVSVVAPSSSTSTSSTTQTTSVSTTQTTSASTTISTSSSTSTTPQSTASSTTSGGGGIPMFPYQIVLAVTFTILLVASYLLIRRRSSL